ncbi:MAG: response regulator [Caenispirillum bisanense]|nr:response regulator [Caenispirillum bisanense]MCA1973441.1 response regulator [Caenispirillum sp.]
MPDRPYDCLDGLNVLVADDNPHIRKLVSTLLSALGRPGSVEEACCGDCALDILATRPVDVAIVDWRMEPVNGIELVRAIREQERARRLPVIMMSGYADPDHMADMRDAGADAVLTKPLGLRRFAATVAAAARRA